MYLTGVTGHDSANRYLQPVVAGIAGNLGGDIRLEAYNKQTPEAVAIAPASPPTTKEASRLATPSARAKMGAPTYCDPASACSAASSRDVSGWTVEHETWTPPPKVRRRRRRQC